MATNQSQGQAAFEVYTSRATDLKCKLVCWCDEFISQLVSSCKQDVEQLQKKPIVQTQLSPPAHPHQKKKKKSPRILWFSAYGLTIFIEYTAWAALGEYANEVLNMRIDTNRTYG